MIRLPNVALSSISRAKLRDYQARIDAGADYPRRVELAKQLFSRHNRRSNATFRTVTRKLDEMCSGARRCAYCEDSAADEVEHIRPKSLYPEQTFAWENYLYSCGPCNSPKGSRFAVFPPGSDEPIEVGRRAKEPVVEPQKGDDVLINPRFEDAMQFLTLDLLGTFLFVPREGLSPRDLRRAQYTCDVLYLNDRDVLPRARQEAYNDYINFLTRYALDRDAGAAAAQLAELTGLLLRRQHPTVWREMQRQRSAIPELKQLFDRVPEAASW